MNKKQVLIKAAFSLQNLFLTTIPHDYDLGLDTGETIRIDSYYTYKLKWNKDEKMIELSVECDSMNEPFVIAELNRNTKWSALAQMIAEAIIVYEEYCGG